MNPRALPLGELGPTKWDGVYSLRLNSAVVLLIDTGRGLAAIRPLRPGTAGAGPCAWDWTAAEKSLAVLQTIGGENFDLDIATQVKACIDAGRQITSFVLDPERLQADYQSYVNGIGENLETQARERREAAQVAS